MRSDQLLPFESSPFAPELTMAENRESRPIEWVSIFRSSAHRESRGSQRRGHALAGEELFIKLIHQARRRRRVDHPAACHHFRYSSARETPHQTVLIVKKAGRPA